jgi:excisionase family DNA binding protein
MGCSTEEWELWTWREVARALKVSRSWIYAKAGSGELPSLRVGGLLRFDPAQVRRFAAPVGSTRPPCGLATLPATRARCLSLRLALRADSRSISARSRSSWYRARRPSGRSSPL